jgi:hypothetical protein
MCSLGLSTKPILWLWSFVFVYVTLVKAQLNMLYSQGDVRCGNVYLLVVNVTKCKNSILRFQHELHL